MWPTTSAVVAFGGATHRSLTCRNGVSRKVDGQPCRIVVVG